MKSSHLFFILVTVVLLDLPAFAQTLSDHYFAKGHLVLLEEPAVDAFNELQKALYLKKGPSNESLCYSLGRYFGALRAKLKFIRQSLSKLTKDHNEVYDLDRKLGTSIWHAEGFCGDSSSPQVAAGDRAALSEKLETIYEMDRLIDSHLRKGIEL